MPEQEQDFYPTPSTISTCMYYTGLDPRTMKEVYVPKSPHEKAMQRALIQYRNPKNYELVVEALNKADRMDLIGFDKNCLIRPRQFSKEKQWVAREKAGATNQSNRNTKPGAKSAIKTGTKLGAKQGTKPSVKSGGNLNTKSNGKPSLDSRTKTSSSQNRKFDDVQRATQTVKQTTVQRQRQKAGNGNAKISSGRSKSQAQGKRR